MTFMHKGYTSADILEQCRKLDEAGIEYNFFYLTGICGKGKSEQGVENTLKVFNELNPKIIGASMLTIYPASELYTEIQNGNWVEESETEKYNELKMLINGLTIKTHFAALGASNAVQLHGNLPSDKTELVTIIDEVINRFGEKELKRYRKNLKHL